MKTKKKQPEWVLAVWIIIVALFSLLFILQPEVTPEQKAANVDINGRARAALTVASNIAPRLHDPKSLEIIYVGLEVNTGAVCITYSAKNLFGGRVKEGFAAVDGRVADYAKVCPRSGRYEDHTVYVKWNL